MDLPPFPLSYPRFPPLFCRHPSPQTSNGATIAHLTGSENAFHFLWGCLCLLSWFPVDNSLSEILDADISRAAL